MLIEEKGFDQGFGQRRQAGEDLTIEKHFNKFHARRQN